jgi:hypothetical protein
MTLRHTYGELFLSYKLRPYKRELDRTLGVWLWIFEMCLIDWVGC